MTKTGTAMYNVQIIIYVYSFMIHYKFIHRYDTSLENFKVIPPVVANLHDFTFMLNKNDIYDKVYHIKG